MKILTGFLLLILITLNSCEKASPVTSILESNLATQYRGYEIGPIRDNIRVVSNPNKESVVLKRNGGIEIIRGDVKLMDSIIALTEAMNKYNIVGLYSNEEYALIYTNYYDSTYEEKIKFDKEYYDFEYDSLSGNSNYCYVLVYSYLNELEVISKLKVKRSILRLDKNWYLFRSNRLAEYSKF